MATVGEILGNTIDLIGLLKSNPELFDFSRLNSAQILDLLREDPALFKDRIDIPKLKPDDRAYLILNLRNKGIVSTITFEEDELGRISLDHYGELVKKDFKKYIRKELYGKMLKGDQAEVFLREPVWVIDNSGKPPRLTKQKLDDLSTRNPTFVRDYISDFSQYSTSSKFWENMIKFDSKYKLIFLQNTDTCTTKTDVRSVIWKYPDIVKLIDGDILGNSKLTCKEWVILIDQILNHNESEFRDWEFSKEVTEIFKMDLTAEMLNGKSKLSARFQNAMKGVFKDKDDEDTTMVGLTP